MKWYPTTIDSNEKVIGLLILDTENYFSIIKVNKLIE